MKTKEGNLLFRTIAEEIAVLVKKYQGSLSGEHGDGRLRGEFIPLMIGRHNYGLLQEVKRLWDPENIFNPHKIVDTPSMNSMLRCTLGQQEIDFQPVFRYHDQTLLQHTEQCNGSGDCRKTELSGETMCPSFMATRDEKDITRTRANILREFLTPPTKDNRFDHKEIYEVMDLCLSCKGCKSECPSNVDVAKLKAGFLQHHYNANGVPMRSKMIAQFSKIASIGSFAPPLYNFMMNTPGINNLIKSFAGFAQQRSMPTLYSQTLSSWYKRRGHKTIEEKKGTVNFFGDEFTNYNDTSIGIKAILLLEKLGYEVCISKHIESGRAALSKGLLRMAKTIANTNVSMLADVVSPEIPLLGVELSAILTSMDEYPDLADEANIQKAATLSKNAFLVDEFIANEMVKGNITPQSFTNNTKKIMLQGHCQQKALSSVSHSTKILSLPANYSVEVIPSGCCGMAGSFRSIASYYNPI